MTQLLEDLISLLNVQKIEANVFKGECQDLGLPQVFGGQVLGQSVQAALNTITDMKIHSLQSYFLRPGDVDKPIYYEVDAIRNGKSFATRRIVAKQHGRAICIVSASFQIEETGFDHMVEMPKVPGPEGIDSEYDQIQKALTQIPESLRSKFNLKRPIEIRVVDPVDFFKPHKRPAQKYVWLRAEGKLALDHALHSVLLAYASDFSFMLTALLPHGVSWANPDIQCASLDHAMWFHRTVNINDWLLYVQDSPSASGGRGFVRGQIFDQAGNLVASTAQEGLIRDRRLKKDSP